MPSNANLYDAIKALINPTVLLYAEYVARIPLPFARYVELGDSYTYFTRSTSDSQGRQVWSDGSFQISIFSSSREQCRSLGQTVASLLDDCVLTYSDARLVFMEPISAVFVPEPHTGPESATVFHRAITFSYSEQRGI